MSENADAMTPSSFMVIARAGAKARAERETVQRLLGDERRHTAELARAGTIAAVYLAADNSAIFLLVPGADEHAVRTLLETFPLYDYLEWEIVRVNVGLPGGAAAP